MLTRLDGASTRVTLIGRLDWDLNSAALYKPSQQRRQSTPAAPTFTTTQMQGSKQLTRPNTERAQRMQTPPHKESHRHAGPTAAAPLQQAHHPNGKKTLNLSRNTTSGGLAASAVGLPLTRPRGPCLAHHGTPAPDSFPRSPSRWLAEMARS
jgi:hypothetical protein